MAKPSKRRKRLAAAAVAVVIPGAFIAGYLSKQSAGISTAQQSAAQDIAAWTPSSVDVGFCQDMAVHHDQAVLMANLAQTRGGPAVKAIADAILLSQSVQIGTMRGWLQLWGEPAAADRPMGWMSASGDHAQNPHNQLEKASDMPGMASAEEILQLWRLSGDAFDILFLQLMTRHHEGGVAMARHAAEHGKMKPLREIAEVMLVQQMQDISQMQRLLQHHNAELLPYP
jgi:uncharacterized protein (DUF305 family)